MEPFSLPMATVVVRRDEVRSLVDEVAYNSGVLAALSVQVSVEEEEDSRNRSREMGRR
jgi:hypothetical protein